MARGLGLWQNPLMTFRHLAWLGSAIAALTAACSSKTPEANVASPPVPAAETPVQQGPTGLPGASGPARIVAGSDACASDADCVPAACCHAAACVARASAPVCSGVMCTQMCQGSTIDCGGGCLCQAGRCSARIVEQTAIAPGGW